MRMVLVYSPSILNTTMGLLENLPNEIFIQIANNLGFADLQACRLVSSLMREKIDRLFSAQWCVILNENSEQDFVAKRKPPLRPPFGRMKIGVVSYFINSTAVKGKRVLSLRREYFENITELEITEFVSQPYFDKIIKLTGNLRILKLSSAVLGGIQNIFGKDILRSNPKRSLRPMLFLRRALPQPLVVRLQQEQSRARPCSESTKWNSLQELHIKLDYVCPSVSRFSPLCLVENLKSVQFLPVPNLSVFTLTVEKSKEAEMFYFTISSLLNTIPLMAYPSLKTISVVSPKCRPINQRESILYKTCTPDKTDFSRMQLSELTVRISEGHAHGIPDALLAILEVQQRSLKTVSIEGIRNAHVLKLSLN